MKTIYVLVVMALAATASPVFALGIVTPKEFVVNGDTKKITNKVFADNLEQYFIDKNEMQYVNKIRKMRAQDSYDLWSTVAISAVGPVLAACLLATSFATFVAMTNAQPENYTKAEPYLKFIEAQLTASVVVLGIGCFFTALYSLFALSSERSDIETLVSEYNEKVWSQDRITLVY